MHKDWLNNRLTVEEAEEKFMDQDDRIRLDPVPFEFYNYYWKKLKSKLQERDELWRFSSPKETWTNFCGRDGI